MIKIVSYEERQDALKNVLNRSASFSEQVDEAVREILADVRSGGDEAVLRLTEKFDGVRPDALKVNPKQFSDALAQMDDDLRSVIEEAAENIRRFHEKQLPESWFTEDGDGVILGQRIVPMERVGLYVPGGTAFYPSSLLMNAIPALVAGVADIHLVSPPQEDGRPHPLVLATAEMLGLQNVYAVGGAQAIGALAYGTAEIPQVDKIVGPGNAYVAAAKKQVYGEVAIDSVAGPSEIVVLADASADASYVAADMLSQAEHDERASAILVTPHEPLAEEVKWHIGEMVPALERREVIEQSLADYGACVVTDSMEQALDLANELAAEHLELIVEKPWDVMTRIRHAGAIFLGPHSSEPVGDYFAGPNHVLPTGGTARFDSALSVHDFLRRQSVISYTEERLKDTGPKIAKLAKAEGLTAHARAVQIRLEDTPADE